MENSSGKLEDALCPAAAGACSHVLFGCCEAASCTSSLQNGLAVSRRVNPRLTKRQQKHQHIRLVPTP